MTVSRGLVIADELVPGTERILRDSDAWFAPDDHGCRPRAELITVLGGHWTAGEAGLGSYDDDGPRVVRGMRARTKEDGVTPLDVSIHFVIGASAEDEDAEALIWQTSDPGLNACCHIGDRVIGRKSIGVEVVSAGMPGRLDLRGRPRVAVPLLGRVRTVLRFFPGQLRAWVWLAETLASLDGRGGIAIPRHVPVFGASRRMTRREARRYAGALEHLHAPHTTKMDAGGLLCGALIDAGWERAQP